MRAPSACHPSSLIRLMVALQGSNGKGKLNGFLLQPATYSAPAGSKQLPATATCTLPPRTTALTAHRHNPLLLHNAHRPSQCSVGCHKAACLGPVVLFSQYVCGCEEKFAKDSGHGHPRQSAPVQGTRAATAHPAVTAVTCIRTHAPPHLCDSCMQRWAQPVFRRHNIYVKRHSIPWHPSMLRGALLSAYHMHQQPYRSVPCMHNAPLYTLGKRCELNGCFDPMLVRSSQLRHASGVCNDVQEQAYSAQSSRVPPQHMSSTRVGGSQISTSEQLPSDHAHAHYEGSCSSWQGS
jgi:hypothetical protein